MSPLAIESTYLISEHVSGVNFKQISDSADDMLLTPLCRSCARSSSPSSTLSLFPCVIPQKKRCPSDRYGYHQGTQIIHSKPTISFTKIDIEMCDINSICPQNIHQQKMPSSLARHFPKQKLVKHAIRDERTANISYISHLSFSFYSPLSLLWQF